VSDHAAATAQIIPFRQPCQGCESLQRQNEEMAGELIATRKALAREHASAERYKQLASDLQEPPADADKLLRFLGWWLRNYAADKDADISITSIKATVARRAHARRKRVYRGRDDADDLAWKDLCFAVIGNRHDRWYASRHAHSLQNVFPAADEERTEKFIRIGRRVEEQKRVAA
jgi:hypothetical protein